jgi:hypothetical protein
MSHDAASHHQTPGSTLGPHSRKLGRWLGATATIEARSYLVMFVENYFIGVPTTFVLSIFVFVISFFTESLLVHIFVIENAKCIKTLKNFKMLRPPFKIVVGTNHRL